jgi:glutaminyl-peptide cyclotransferase
VPVRLLVVALGLQLLLGAALLAWALAGTPGLGLLGDGGGRSPAPAGPPHDPAALADVRRIVAFGPRPAGSPASRRLAAWLRARVPRGRYEAVPGGLRNVVGSLPGREPAIVLGAHYDTKELPGFVGANDGAAPDTVVLKAARALARGRRPADAPALRFVFFDGEESPRGTPDAQFVHRGLRGSKAYALAHHRRTREMILVDFVGQRNLVLRRERGSDRRLWARLRAGARRAGVGAAFPPGTAPLVLDDHTPFTALGVPAIDLIDFDYACFHRPCDALGQISGRSLATAARAVIALLRAGG